jgi:signal transduction histidine kinase
MELPGPVDAGGSASADPGTPPATAWSRSARPSVSELILVAGAVLTAVLIGLAAIDTGQTGVWQNLHWNVSAIAAFLAVTFTGTGLNGRERLLRLSAAVAIGIWLLANLLWTEQVATNQRVIPSLPDLLAAVVLLPAAVALVAYVRGRLSRAEELAVYIDATVVGTTVFAYLLIGVGPTIERLGAVGGLLSLLAPLAYLTMAGTGLVALLATGHPISRRGGYPIVAGVALIGVAWVGWSLPAATSLGQPAMLAGSLFSIGILLVGLGASTAHDSPSRSVRYRRMAGFMFRAIGPFAAGLTLLTILPIGTRSEAIDAALRVTVILAGSLILIRQGLLLRERTAVVAELQAVRHENERLVDTLRGELDERLRVQDQLINASRMAAVGELAAGVAHEVNNPLTGVLGFSELLLEEMPVDDPKRADIRTIWEEAMRARSIVRALRDFARPTSPLMIPTDLPELVRGAIDLIRYPLKRAGVTIVESYGELSLMELDPHAIQQVMLNVLTNAMQAMPRGGTLTVEAISSGSEVVVTIADDGEGMDEIAVGQAFVPFFTGRQESGASGLGLSATLGLVESHGGTIHLESQLGVGTTVAIRLPVTRPEPPGQSTGVTSESTR